MLSASAYANDQCIKFIFFSVKKLVLPAAVIYIAIVIQIYLNRFFRKSPRSAGLFLLNLFAVQEKDVNRAGSMFWGELLSG